MFETALKNKALQTAAGAVAPGKTVRLGGVWGSSAALLSAALGRLTNRPVLLVTAHLDDADEAADDIEVLIGRPAHLLPAWEVDIGAERANSEVTGERLRLCNALAAGDFSSAGGVIVAPAMALLQPLPTREALAECRLSLARGGTLSPEDLSAWLVDAGFERVEQVDQAGQFARRGGIVDIFAPGTGQAVRVEFFGDEIDSIRAFDLDTQRSTEPMERFDVLGAALTAGQVTSLAAYLPPETLLCVPEPAEVMELAGELYRRVAEDAAGRDGAAGLLDPEDVFAALAPLAQAELHTFAPADGETPAVDLGIRSLQRLAVNTGEALGELEQLSESNAVWVYCENPAEQARFAEVLAETHPALAGRVHTAVGHLHAGFYWPSAALAAVGHHEIYHRYAKVRRIRRVRSGRPIDSLLDLSEGDYVVHVAHGIAKFDGLRRLESEGGAEYLTLRFADNAVIHVPASQIELVQKYIGTGRKRPTLSKLGGVGWQRTKQRAAEAVKDLAAEMLRVQAVREAAPGVSYPRQTKWQRQFCDEFLYTETADQLSAMGNIDEDMVQSRPMDRLLCGDVGYGKTELAMRAAFKAAEAGKQTAVLVPTTVLASQHFRTFSERMADYPFNVEVISRFRTAAEQDDIVKRLALGQIDVLIGTHRLLSKDVKFAELGLVVIDEEQRFGVAAKEHLKGLRASVDVLTMTATPIPRTLHMALLGLRDISSLSTPPMDRRAIHTEVCHADDELIRHAIVRELNREGQVFFVHNRVGGIQSVAEHIRVLVPEARVIVGHGQMPERGLEKTMLQFVRGGADVLVCTTIIESGLDIPTANTIIINNADRFGLAELHQLRGRVGRYKHKAFCYLLLPEDRPVSPVAARRLKAIEEFSDLGAGFQIAMRDLEIRGAGNILGVEQSGHIAAVGYEMYCRLLERTVAEMRGEEAPQRPDVHVDVGIEAAIPKNYVPSERQRMEIYRRFVRCRTAEELEQLRADLADAYGRVPPAVETLADLAEVRIRSAACGIDSIIRMDPDIIFTVRDMTAARAVFEGSAGTARMADAETLHWRLPKAYLEGPTLLRVLLKRLRQADKGV